MNTAWMALTKPNRLHMVELTVGEIAQRLRLRRPQVSKHLKVLCEASLVEVRPQANLRISRLRHEPFQELEAWLQSFHHLWEEHFERLDTSLLKLQASGLPFENRNEDEFV